MMNITKCVEYIEIANAEGLPWEIRQGAIGFVAEWFAEQPIDVREEITARIAIRAMAKFQRLAEEVKS